MSATVDDLNLDALAALGDNPQGDIDTMFILLSGFMVCFEISNHIYTQLVLLSPNVMGIVSQYTAFSPELFGSLNSQRRYSQLSCCFIRLQATPFVSRRISLLSER